MDADTFPSPSPASEALSPLDRFLSLFADVRAGEGLTALLLMIDVFLLPTTYQLAERWFGRWRATHPEEREEP